MDKLFRFIYNQLRKGSTAMINVKRKKYISFILLIFSILPLSVFADSPISLNSLGFMPEMPKRATISAECSTFSVIQVSDSKIIFTGTAEGPIHQDDIGKNVWIADFSTVKTPGMYYLEVDGLEKSVPFPIGKKVYDEVYCTAMRGFYLWRCGVGVKATHNGEIFAHSACHTDDGWQDYIGEKGTRRDGVGGWHDAGDYGKYTVNAGVTLGVLFLGWDQFQVCLKDISLDIPDTAKGYPDYLKELKWETGWLLKMQYSDGTGRVSHKLTRLGFSGFIMPEDDHEKRYFTDWSTAATADFVAVMATAARIFKPYDSDYAKVCLDAASLSYKCLKDHLGNKSADLSAFSTGGYGTHDNDDRLWAYAAMWETTGESNYLIDFEASARNARRLVDANWDWSNVGNLGMFTYILSKRPGRDPELVETVRRALIDTADSIVETAKADVYARPLGGRYYWGCNGTVARQTVILYTANQIQPDSKYINASLDAVAHLFGRNYYGRSYVTGEGHKPPLHPHDRRSGADDVINPWPGYLVGGGHSATNWQDLEEDYKTNEIAINWQAALVYALAGAMSQNAD